MGILFGKPNPPTNPPKTNPTKQAKLEIKDGADFTYNTTLTNIKDDNLIKWIKEQIKPTSDCTLYQCINDDNTYSFIIPNSDAIKCSAKTKYTFYILETNEYYYCFKSEIQTKSDIDKIYTSFKFDQDITILGNPIPNIQSDQSFTKYKKPSKTTIFCTSNAFIFKNNNEYIFNTPDQNEFINSFCKIDGPNDLITFPTITETDTSGKTNEINGIVKLKQYIKDHNKKLAKYINDLKTTNLILIRGNEIMFKKQDNHIFCTTYQSECTSINEILLNLTHINNFVLSYKKTNNTLTNRIKISNPTDPNDKSHIFYTYTEYKITYNKKTIDYKDKLMHICYKDNEQLFGYCKRMGEVPTITKNVVNKIINFDNPTTTTSSYETIIDEFINTFSGLLEDKDLDSSANLILGTAHLPIRLYMVDNLPPFKPHIENFS